MTSLPTDNSTMSTITSWTNLTSSDADLQPCSVSSDSSNLMNRIVTQVSVAVLMFGLGCSADVKEMWGYIKQIKQFITALVLQLILMPFLGFGLSQAVQMTDGEAIGVIIQASCPGGIYSNIISYYLDGSIHLSIVMTTMSTVIVLGTLPLWLYVFPLILQVKNNCLRVPFESLGYALLGLIVPLVIGLLVKLKFPQQSERITKICTLLGSLSVLIYAIVVATTGDNDFLNDISWRIVVVAFLQLFIGFLMGYLATRLPWFNFSVAARRTVAIETALQNSALATTIVLVSFDVSYSFFGSIFLYPLVYSGLQLVIGFLSVILYLLLKYWGKCSCLIPEEEVEEETGNEAEVSAQNPTKNGLSNPTFYLQEGDRISSL